MTEIKLNRTGQRPVVFIGKQLASASSKDHNSTRWVKVEVFENQKGSLIVGVGHLTCWQGESDHYTVNTFKTKDQVMDWVEEVASPVAEAIAEQLGAVEVIE